MLDPARGHTVRKSRVPPHHQHQQQRIVPQQHSFPGHNQPLPPQQQHFFHQQYQHIPPPLQQQQVFLPPHPFQQGPPPLVAPPAVPHHYPQWPHHPDLPYKSPEPRSRSRTNSGKKRPSLRISGGGSQTANVDVLVHHGAGNGPGGASVERRGRSRSRAGSVSFPCDQDRMSPSVEKSYNFGLPGHSRQGSQDNATYVELCFPPPASFNMNGSQPCLNSLNSLQPLNKAPGRFKRNGSQPCLRAPDQGFKRQLSTPVDAAKVVTHFDGNGQVGNGAVVSGEEGSGQGKRSLPKSASFDETQTALDVVRTKRAKQHLLEKSGSRGGGGGGQAEARGGARTTKSGLSGERERTVGCTDLVQLASTQEKEVRRERRSKTPTPHNSRPVTPSHVSPGHVPHVPPHNHIGAPPIPPHGHSHHSGHHHHPEVSIMLSPETALPPPPSPPCTCGKVLGDMGPPPAVDEWDNHSIDSKGTLGSRRSQGYVSMTSASTYLIDATGADPVLVPGGGAEVVMNGRANGGYRDPGYPQGPDMAPHQQHNGHMFGYPVEGGGLMSHSDLAPLCGGPPAPVQTAVRSRPRPDPIIKKTSSFPRQPNGNLSNGNGAPKNFSVNSDENERGVTFRVGKFIGQVTIESVKFRRQHWLFLLICLLVFVIILSIYLPIASRADDIEDPEHRIMVIKQMLREVPLIDGHNDLAWNIRQFIHNKLSTVNFSADLSQVEPWANSKWSHTDIPRLVKGNLGAQLWVAYAPCGSQHKDAVQITLEQIDLIKRFIEQYSANLQFVTSSSSLVEAHKGGKIASVITVESGHSIGTSLAVLRMYYRLGARSLTLTHNCNNPWADSSLVDKEGSHPVHNGLTSFGKTVINEMNRLGMIVDLSHSSVKTALDTLEVSVAPVIFSHSSAQHICNSTRNVPDHLLQKTAAKGGLVMINFFSYFITCKNVSSITDVIAHINHVREVAGIDSVGIGASYDGINEVPTGLEDVSKYVELFSALYASGKWSVQVGRRMSGEADIGEERIPAEDMLSVPTDCKSGTYKDKRSVDSGGSGTALC